MASINADSKSGTMPVRPGGVPGIGQAADAATPPAPREKTAMCLVNEMARFNKLKHQYTLTDEVGPAHKKTFYVQLKLGDEEYSANESSIKRAQHLAAQQALARSKFKKPPPKEIPNLDSFDGSVQGRPTNVNTITPTVELNALAMKRGEKVVYTPMEAPKNAYVPADFVHGPYNQRRFQRAPRLFCVSLRIGHREFIGEGQCRQGARHNAADKALKLLRTLPIPDKDGAGEDGASDNESNSDLKSEISLVHELALRRKLTIEFVVTNESGPAHMRNFTTDCIVGDLKTTGEGNSKKSSKKKAAQLMLEEMKQLGPLPAAPVKNKPKNNGSKKKNRNLIKMQKAAPEYGQNINPISRLIQIQQAKREREPEYRLLEEKGLARKREFVIQVEVGGTTCTGVGPNKKLAKRAAAEAMLQSLGYNKPALQPDKPSIKTNRNEQGTDGKKVKFADNTASPAPTVRPQQLVPGLIVLPQTNTSQNSGVSPSRDSHDETHVVRPKQQLLYLADVLGFQVQFTDFPKGSNKNEYLSLVSLSTNPPQVSHGAGCSKEDSHDAAALTALRTLSKYGLDQVTSGDSNDPGAAAGNN